MTDNIPDKDAALDPQVRVFLETVATANPPTLDSLTPGEARALYRIGISAVAGVSPEVAESRDLSMPGPAGPIALRLYRPRANMSRADASGAEPVVVYFHGGGWCFGDLDSHDHVCRRLAIASGCVVVSVDYRLAPEHKFPAAVVDAEAAIKWVALNAADLGIDPGHLAVAGDSAGGTLATVAAMLLSGDEAVRPRFQLLIYPATDLTMALPSHAMFGIGYRLTRPLMLWSTANYLRDGGDLTDPRASPLFAGDLARMPPALILTAGFDPLRDEGQAYARKLAAAGVPVTHQCHAGMIHGFIGMTGILDTARQALDEAGGSVGRALGARRAG